ncbi:SAM domain-containing protein SAMSN-1, partial [Chelonia mydas]
RTSSFGNFDRFRHHSVSKPDDSVEICEVETVSDIGDLEQNKMAGNGGSLGKKMRAISLTMKKKMGKKYIKALSEDMNEEGKEDYSHSDPGDGTHTEKVCLKASDSMDSLYSLNSGQSSSSGVTSCSDGTSNRDSFRLTSCSDGTSNRDSFRLTSCSDGTSNRDSFRLTSCSDGTSNRDSFRLTSCSDGTSNRDSFRLTSCSDGTSNRDSFRLTSCSDGTSNRDSFRLTSCSDGTSNRDSFRLTSCSDGTSNRDSFRLTSCSDGTSNRDSFRLTSCSDGTSNRDSFRLTSCSDGTSNRDSFRLTSCSDGTSNRDSFRLTSCSDGTSNRDSFRLTSCSDGTSNRDSFRLTSCSDGTSNRDSFRLTSCSDGTSNRDSFGVTSCSDGTSNRDSFRLTSCSDGTSNRDSFRLDDEVPYTGPFCGRAKVHTDFTPSPYDNDSLKIKKGDIIDIICKTPMGMWTGMLNNKVGNFKFIYVDIILEAETTPRKIKVHRGSKRAKPKTLQELLERVHLQEYSSTLLLNGYETLEDLKELQESHLIELNITNPEDRTRLLSAVENLQDYETEQEHENEQQTLTLRPELSFNKSEVNDCPRDSGCYILSENSDNGKEELDPENVSDVLQTITITETN